MLKQLSHVSLLVPDQQEALSYYTDVLGFELCSNDPFPDNPEARWITVTPGKDSAVEVVLEPPEWGPEAGWQERRDLIGKYPGFIIKTDNCRKDYESLKAKGVEFTGPVEEMPWGISAMMVDKYGYTHNLVEDL